MTRYLAIALILLTGCEASDMAAKEREIKVSLGGSIDTVLSSTAVKLRKDCDDAMCLFKFVVPSRSSDLITVKMQSVSSTLTIENVHSTTIVTSPSGLITAVDVDTAGVASNAKHEDAMAYFSRQMQNLKATGWHRYIFPDEARIPSSEVSKFKDMYEVLGKDVGSGPWMDPYLERSKEVWVSMRMFDPWRLYNGDEYLTFRVQRENSEDDPQNHGSYLFSWTFESENEFYAQFVKGEDRKRWKELLPAELARMAKEREKTEAQLKKMGIQIDESYKDAKPPVKAD